MADVLVIKCNVVLKPKHYEDIYTNFVNQKAMGVVVLPLGFEATVVPDDVTIIMEGE